MANSKKKQSIGELRRYDEERVSNLEPENPRVDYSQDSIGEGRRSRGYYAEWPEKLAEVDDPSNWASVEDEADYLKKTKPEAIRNKMALRSALSGISDSPDEEVPKLRELPPTRFTDALGSSSAIRGYYDRNRDSLTLPSTTSKGFGEHSPESEGPNTHTMAHEVTHSRGGLHTDEGLMAPYIDKSETRQKEAIPALVAEGIPKPKARELIIRAESLMSRPEGRNKKFSDILEELKNATKEGS